MNLLTDKLAQTSMKDVELLIEQHKLAEFPLKPSSVKKMYRNWLRNDDETRTFKEVFKRKLTNYGRKMKRAHEEFTSMQVGWIEFDYDQPSYVVNLHGEQPYKVYWASYADNPLARMEQSVLKFCETNSVKLKQSGQPNIKVIQTVFSP